VQNQGEESCAASWNRFSLVAGLVLTIAPAHSDDYPSRRITLIAPWPPAGASVGDLLGQPVVVENRPSEGSVRPNIIGNINDISVTYLPLGTP